MSMQPKMVLDFDQKRVLAGDEAAGFSTHGVVATVGSVPAAPDRSRARGYVIVAQAHFRTGRMYLHRVANSLRSPH